VGEEEEKEKERGFICCQWEHGLAVRCMVCKLQNNLTKRAPALPHPGQRIVLLSPRDAQKYDSQGPQARGLSVCLRCTAPSLREVLSCSSPDTYNTRCWHLFPWPRSSPSDSSENCSRTPTSPLDLVATSTSSLAHAFSTWCLVYTVSVHLVFAAR